MEKTDFHFSVHMDGKITFEIHYEQGILPEVFPEPRTRVSRAAQKAAKAEREAAPAEETTTTAQEETVLAIIPEAPVAEPAENEAPAEATEEAMAEEVSENHGNPLQCHRPAPE